MRKIRNKFETSDDTEYGYYGLKLAINEITKANIENSKDKHASGTRSKNTRKEKK